MGSPTTAAEAGDSYRVNNVGRLSAPSGFNFLLDDDATTAQPVGSVVNATESEGSMRWKPLVCGGLVGWSGPCLVINLYLGGYLGRSD